MSDIAQARGTGRIGTDVVAADLVACSRCTDDINPVVAISGEMLRAAAMVPPMVLLEPVM